MWDVSVSSTDSSLPELYANSPTETTTDTYNVFESRIVLHRQLFGSHGLTDNTSNTFKSVGLLKALAYDA